MIPTILGLSHVRRPPKWTILGRNSLNHKASGVPGPGSYGEAVADNTSRYRRGPCHSFGTAGREYHLKVKVPGPGTYPLPSTVGAGAHAYSISPRPHDKLGQEGNLPGPGSYGIRSSVGTGPGCKLPKRPDDAKEKVVRSDDQRTSRGPGPGKYNLDQADGTVHEKGPQWSFGSSERPKTSGPGGPTPGPTAYVVASTLGAGPHFTMQGRHPGPRLQPSPGPGSHGGHYSSFFGPEAPVQRGFDRLPPRPATSR